ncbi:MAG: hypothetical protein Q9225_004416 [Loekoesia sp. 1 TL-2023]
MSLQLEGFHAFITDAASSNGSAAVDEFLSSLAENGCKVTALYEKAPARPGALQNLHSIEGSLTEEAFIESAFVDSRARFGPVNVLVIANAATGLTEGDCPIWETALDTLDLTYRVSFRWIFLVMKHFLRSIRSYQHETKSDLQNLAVVLVESGMADPRHVKRGKYTSGTSGMLHGLVQAVKHDLEYINSKATINVLARVSKPEDVGRAIVTVASHHAIGQFSGEYLSVCIPDNIGQNDTEPAKSAIVEMEPTPTSVSKPLTIQTRHRVRVALSVDFDAISGHLGTGKHPGNNMSDYSAGIFAGKVGALRLLRLFKKLDLADKMTWFIPGHSMETFPGEVKQIVESGCEIGLHGYSHERVRGAYQMTEEQESDVLQKCIKLATQLTGKKPVGYRAPLYQIRETTIPLLEKYGFEYDSSLTHHDSQPYLFPLTLPIQPPDFSKPASTWMHPTPLPSTSSASSPNTNPNNQTPRFSSLIEIPCNWYGEDETPLSYLPHVPNSHGYVDVRVIEQMWKDRFMWLWEHAHEEREDQGGSEQRGTSVQEGEAKGEEKVNDFVFPIVLHPDTSGMAHVIGMVERILRWLKGWGSEVEFWRYEDIAREAKVRAREKEG